MRNRVPESRSVMKKRRLWWWPATSVAFTCWPSRFPNRSMEVNIFEQSEHGTSTCWGVGAASVAEAGG